MGPNQIFIFLVLFLFQQIGVGSNLWAAAQKNKTLVIYAGPEGSESQANAKTAELLRQKLQTMPFLHMVDPKNVDAVLHYYQNYRLSSDGDAVAKAKTYLARAKDHYFQLAYSETKLELAEIFQIFKERPELVFTDGLLLFDSWLTLGLTHAALKQKVEAVQALQQAFRLNPFYKIDPQAVAPSVRRLMQEAKDQLKALQPFAHLKIAGQPKVTEIYLNGIYQGVSSKTLELPAGEYSLSFKAQHYRPFQQHLLLKPEESLTLTHKLYWEGPRPTGPRQKSQDLSRRFLDEGLRVAELLKVDKVLLVDVNKDVIQTQLIDRQYRAAHKPIYVALQPDQQNFDERLNQLVRLIYAQTQLNLLKNPHAHLDPEGIGDPILLGGRPRKISKGVLWGGLGALGVAGIVAALLAGGSSAANTGTLALSFR